MDDFQSAMPPQKVGFGNGGRLGREFVESHSPVPGKLNNLSTTLLRMREHIFFLDLDQDKPKLQENAILLIQLC